MCHHGHGSRGQKEQGLLCQSEGETNVVRHTALHSRTGIRNPRLSLQGPMSHWRPKWKVTNTVSSSLMIMVTMHNLDQEQYQWNGDPVGGWKVWITKKGH